MGNWLVGISTKFKHNKPLNVPTKFLDYQGNKWKSSGALFNGPAVRPAVPENFGPLVHLRSGAPFFLDRRSNGSNKYSDISSLMIID